jgi:hypothetical protein
MPLVLDASIVTVAFAKILTVYLDQFPPGPSDQRCATLAIPLLSKIEQVNSKPQHQSVSSLEMKTTV